MTTRSARRDGFKDQGDRALNSPSFKKALANYQDAQKQDSFPW